MPDMMVVSYAAQCMAGCKNTNKQSICIKLFHCGIKGPQTASLYTTVNRFIYEYSKALIYGSYVYICDEL